MPISRPEIPVPSVLILTHRRGAALAIWKTSESFPLTKEVMNEIISTFPVQYSTGSSGSNVETIRSPHLLLKRVLGHTAENLYNLYTKSLSEADLMISAVKTVIIGSGPGSFTGLRLGAAFANGLKTGNPALQLSTVNTLLTSSLLEFWKELEVSQRLTHELGPDCQPHDESTGFITFFDIAAALCHISKHQIQPLESVVPHYGREPGPVLALQLLKEKHDDSRT